MSYFDDIAPSKPISDKRGEKMDLSAQCAKCGSQETETFRADEYGKFDVHCVDCGFSYRFALPGV
jgi:ribosomal protein L44E